MFVLDCVGISIWEDTKMKFHSFHHHLGFYLAAAVKLQPDVASLVNIIKRCHHGARRTREIEFCLETKTRWNKILASALNCHREVLQCSYSGGQND